jgi:hypothetical protein
MHVCSATVARPLPDASFANHGPTAENRSPTGVAPLWTGLPTRKVAVHSVAPGAPLGGGVLGDSIPVIRDCYRPGQWE